MNFLNKYSQYRDIVLFLLKCIGLYFLWLLLKMYLLFPFGKVDTFLISQITNSTAKFLNFLGYETYLLNTYVGISEFPGVMIAYNCNGLSLMALFAGFIIAFTGKTIHKTWFILLGIILIHLFNVLRTALLAILVSYKPEWTEFNHKYTFTAIIYILIFILWIIWVNKFSFIKAKNEN
jgi:exosortase family protein XrtF